MNGKYNTTLEEFRIFIHTGIGNMALPIGGVIWTSFTRCRSYFRLIVARVLLAI